MLGVFFCGENGVWRLPLAAKKLKRLHSFAAGKKKSM